MKRWGKVSSVFIIGLLIAMPVLSGVEQDDTGTITFSIRGGNGITLGVINRGDKLIDVSYNITTRTGTLIGCMTVPPQTEVEHVSGSPSLSKVVVTLSLGDIKLRRRGFTVLVLTFFLPGEIGSLGEER